MESFFKEFKTFAMRGNVIDLAVAVVIGAAFSKIVSSLVDNIITPTMGFLMGSINFSNLSIDLGGVALTYGAFIQAIIDFLIVAFVIFLVVKTINKIKREDEVEDKEKSTTPPEEILLLREIRDTLRQN